jgi:uncharacterized repeat protein (TIGR01451 family)
VRRMLRRLLEARCVRVAGLCPARMLLAIVLTLIVFAVAAGLARAEGSAQLYPLNATCAPNSASGSCRANIEWRTDAYGPASGAQVRRRSYMQVYAQAGEVLAMGSSAVGVGSGDILVYNPGVVTDSNAEPLPAIVTGVNGFRCSDQRTASGIAAQGRITSRAQELAGPQAVDGSGNLSGYVPCSYVAPATGIYGVVFYGQAGDGSAADGGPTADINLTAASNFDATQGTSVAAWDLTVRSSVSSTTAITGRLFTNALIAFTGGNGRPVNSRLEVVTLDGFRYQVDTRGLDPNGFAFYGNQVGFLDGDGVTPLYHDASGTTSSSELTGLAGGVTLAAPTFPIFFGAPAAATLTALSIPTTPVAPVISSVSFAGNITGSTSSLGAGGTFTYSANVSGVYQIVISRDGVNFDPGAAQNRVLRGVRTSGTQTVTWDGKDNSGADFPVGAGYAVRASLHAGEYHFPLLDAENSTLGGPTFTLLNPPGGVCPGGSCTTGYFDDRGYRTLGPASATVGSLPPPDSPLCGTAPPAAPDHSDPVTGYDTTSSLRAYGTNTGGNTNVPCTGSFGDVKGLDAWTYFPSTAASSSLDIVNSADVSITKTHIGSFTVGTNGSFTLTVANAGLDASGALTVTDALPAGLGYVSGTGAGWTCGAVGATVTCSNPAGLAFGGSTTITLTVSVGPAAAPSTTNTASVSAVRADPNTANNSSSDPVSVTPIPLAVDDTATTPQNTPVTIGVTANDNLGQAPATITSHTAPAHGSATCTSSSCTYSPAAGFAGIDTFDYTITDANGRTSTAKVTITVTVTATAPPAPTPAPAPAPAPAAADLATTVHGPASTAPGEVVHLVATVRNNGPGSAEGAEATLTVPAGFTLRPGTIAIDGALAGSACVVAGASFSCQLGTLAAGDTVQITWQATVGASAAAGAHVVRSNVDSTTTDSVPANNPSRWVIRVERNTRPAGNPRLGVRITLLRKTVRPGEVLKSTVVVSNSGTATARNVVLCVPAPAHATFVSAPGASFRNGSACWSIGDLGAHASRRFAVVLRVNRTASPGAIRVVAIATRRAGRRPVSSHAAGTVLPGRAAVRPGGVTG